MTTNVQQVNQTVTKHGVPIDNSFGAKASEESLQKAAAAIRSRGLSVEVVDAPEDARNYVISILPKDKSILTVSSETVRLSGLDEDINRSGKYISVRQQLEKLDRSTQMPEMRKLGATPDVVVGSVQAVTEDGQLLVASASGSQVGPYSAGAAKVVLVVGSQKIVPDLETGLRRLSDYSYPLEDIRAREKYGMGSFLAKILIIRGDWPVGRSTVVLVREPIGF